MATPEQITEATSLGWAPKDQWRGAEDKWVDADVFLEKGLGIHHVRDQNRRLEGQVQQIGQTVSSLESALKAANATIEALNASHEEDVKAQVEAARAELKEEIERASKEGDHAGLAEATDKLTQLNTADAAAKEKDKNKDKLDDAGKPQQIPPEVAQWYAANPEYQTNPRMRGLAMGVAAELRAAGDTTTGKVFLDKVAAEVEKTLGIKPGAGRSKVESDGGGSRGAGGGNSDSKTYADLPAEAKAACEAQAKRLVGANRAHKTIESWRASYARQYFGE